MATLPISFALGSFQTGAETVESPRKLTSNSHLFDKRLFNCGDTIDGQKGLAYQRRTGSKKIYSLRKDSIKAHALSSIPFEKVDKKSSKYLFRTQNGDQVKVVVVVKKRKRYSVSIEILPLDLNSLPKKLILSWGIYRSDYSSFIPLKFQNLGTDDKKTISEVLVAQNSFGTYTIEMEFESYLTPFYLSFVLRYPLSANEEFLEIKTHRHTSFNVPVGFNSGYPAPLGVSHSSDGKINFALFSRNVDRVILCLYDDDDDVSQKPGLEIELDPYVNRTGNIWHASLDSIGPFLRYGYCCERTKLNGKGNKVLLDPYAKLIWKNAYNLPSLGELTVVNYFDWGGDISPRLPMEKLVVYRLNVKHFSRNIFSGVTENLHHFTNLGVNAILLEPIFPYTEEKGPYFPLHFFALQQEYRSNDCGSAINSMKEMVKKLHANGIEVYMEVVFTHTADDGALQEIDYPSYFYAHGDRDMGAPNALNCNHPIVQQLIVDSLRYWVTEFHIDGFSFLNSSCLMKGFHGETLTCPPLIEAIAFDPILSTTKLIADFWDPNDLASKEMLFPHWKRWAEMNSRFHIDVRMFLKGEGLLSSLATRLCGSGDIFSIGRGSSFSFNYITRNFGLSLVDLVSYSNNELASELSWNCGEEGPTNNEAVLERRLKQIRNFLFILFVSLGVPVLNMGDECGQSSGGSPTYGDRKPFNWDALKTSFGVQITTFVSYLISVRERRSDLLQKRGFLEAWNIDWYDSDLSQPKWDDPSAKFLAMLLKTDHEESRLISSKASLMKGDLYVAFNSGEHSRSIILPPPPEKMEWVCLVDTALTFPGFFSSSGIPFTVQTPELVSYGMKSHSCVLFETRFKGD